MEIKAKYVVWKIMLYLIGALTFVSLGILLLLQDGDDSSVVQASGLATILFFGACAILFLRRLYDRRPVLLIDRDSLFDRRVMDRAMPWQDVLSINAMAVSGHRYFAVTTKTPFGAYTCSRLKKGLLALNKFFYGMDLYVAASCLDTGFDDIGKALAHHAHGTP